jgi:hypothetical protein
VDRELGLAGPRRDWLLVLGARAAASAAVLTTGFRAVSDDDYARVVLAQGFAAAPRLDPTGTSWLPFPFWVTGACMRLSSTTTLFAARVVAVLLGLASSLLLLAAARLLVRDCKAALVGALVASVFPWSARLGVATVPELPTAALSVFGLASLASSCGRTRVAGAVALFAATLSRYEPWFLAAGFLLASAVPGLSAPVRPSSRRVAAALALLGPLAWIAHNAHAHGAPLHFVARVSAYHRAVGGNAALAAIGYPLALLREEPELWLLVVAPLLSRGRVALPTSLRGPLASLGAMVVALSLAAARGGAPTHHNGRAMLAVWLVVALGLGAGAWHAFAAGGRRRVALLAACAVVLPLGALVLRPWYARLDSMAARADEEGIGALVRANDADAVLLEVRDFGFFAIEAGSGAPERFILDRSLDPREPERASSFRDEAALRERLRHSGARHVVAHEGEATRWLGAPLAAAGSLRLWRVPPR